MVKKDLTGKRIGRLTVLRLSDNKKNRSIKWVCQCDCGNIVEANNKRNNHFVEYKGKKYTISQLAEEKNIKYDILLYRINKGWDLEDAINLPVMKGGPKYAYRRNNY